MLKTPFGNIYISFDDEPIDFEIKKGCPDARLYPDVKDVYLLSFPYKCDGKKHNLKCYIKDINTNIEWDFDSGERLEAITFYRDNDKMTIGCESTFYIPEEYGYDFDGKYLDNGLEIHIEPETKSQEFIFGISWLLNCTDEKDCQTWFASDPNYHK